MGIELENALKLETRLGDSFVIKKILGVGGFGITYKAYAEHLEADVAIKEFFPTDYVVRNTNMAITIRSNKDEDKKFFQYGLNAFKAEAKTLARFAGHPNIVHVYHYIEANGTAYMIMQYEEGITFEEWLRINPNPSQEDLLALIIPILDGLREVHSSDYLHKDIKPDNIYIRSDGRPLLIDFGSARQNTAATPRSRVLSYCDGYSPFEQYNSNSKLGAWSDIYSIGATLYHAIHYSQVGTRLPSSALERSCALVENDDDPLQPAEHIGKGRYSVDFLQAIDWALAFLSKNRPQTVQEFQNRLQGEKRSDKKKNNPYPKPKKRVFWLAAMVVLFSLGGGYLFFSEVQRQQEVELKRHKEAQRQQETELKKHKVEILKKDKALAQQIATEISGVMTKMEEDFGDIEDSSTRVYKMLQNIKAVHGQSEGISRDEMEKIKKAQTEVQSYYDEAAALLTKSRLQLDVAQSTLREINVATDNGELSKAQQNRRRVLDTAKQMLDFKNTLTNSISEVESRVNIAQNTQKKVLVQQVVNDALTAKSQLEAALVDVEKYAANIKSVSENIRMKQDKVQGFAAQEQVLKSALSEVYEYSNKANTVIRQVQSEVDVANRAVDNTQALANNTMLKDAAYYKDTVVNAVKQVQEQVNLVKGIADKSQAQMALANDAVSEAEELANIKAVSQSSSTPSSQLSASFQGDIDIAKEAYSSKDYSTAFKHYQALSVDGDVEILNKLGLMYAKGRGVNQDYHQALSFYMKAANQGHAPAMRNLGRLYHKGNGVEKDYSEASQWYKKSVTQGEWRGIDIAEKYLGDIYLKGDNTTDRDFSEAESWYRKAAKRRNMGAQFQLGLIYHKAKGVKQNYSEAAIWYKKAAEQGYIDAQAKMGLFYREGYGVSQDYDKAIGWYRKAANQGHLPSEKALRKMRD